MRTSDSHLWKNIARVWPVLTDFEAWSIGNGEAIHAWNDRWIGNGIVLRDFTDTIPGPMKDWHFNDMVDDTGEWNWNVLATLLPDGILNRIRAVCTPNLHSGDDVRVWPGERLGMFSVSSAYGLLKGHHLLEGNEVWRKIWKLEAPERVKCFICQVVLGRLITNSRKYKWGLGSEFCSHCGNIVEIVLHVLRDCPLASLVWQHLVNMDDRSQFFHGDLQHWVTFNLTVLSVTSIGGLWACTCAHTCHILWKWKNRQEHDGNVVRPIRLWELAKKQVDQYGQAKNVAALMKDRKHTCLNVKWVPPRAGWVSLNTNRAANSTMGKVGCGGVVCLEDGRWVMGFSKFLGNTNAFMAELWGSVGRTLFGQREGILFH